MLSKSEQFRISMILFAEPILSSLQLLTNLIINEENSVLFIVCGTQHRFFDIVAYMGERGAEDGLGDQHSLHLLVVLVLHIFL